MTVSKKKTPKKKSASDLPPKGYEYRSVQVLVKKRAVKKKKEKDE